METEDIEEEICLEPEEPAPRKGASQLWVLLTVIFVVLCAILAWLYTEQLSQLQALRADAEQARSEATRVRGAASRVAADIVELGHQAALAAQLQESLGNRKRAEADIARSRKFLDLAAQLSTGAASSQKQAVVDKIKEIEERLYPSVEEPTAEGEAAGGEAESEEAGATTEAPEPEPAKVEGPSPE